MTRVRVVCPGCGAEPQLLPAAIRVLVVGESDKAADVRVVKMLRDAGCPVTVTEVDTGPTVAWVGRFACGHDGAGRDLIPPAPGGWHVCDECERTRELVDVIVGRKVAA